GGGSGPTRGGRPMGVARSGDGDGALAHKTSRDYQGGKNYDKNREERRENGRRGDQENRQGQNHRQFNYVPKALQQKSHGAGTGTDKEVVTEIRLPERITVRDLAEKMKIPAPQLVKELFLKGLMVTVNHEISFEQAQEIALAHDIIAEAEEKEDVIGALLAEDVEDEKELVSRPPVVCVMGHVDHGKTSLLDAIRNTHVTDKEAGGITQHIGAYMVSINGQKITFLDTPGHEAFTAMRMRGANSTDIAVLVVAADDGVMPQTVEAINHAKAANVTVIVAVNKIDKPGANVDRVYQELSEYGLLAEEWGGDTVFCKVSAKTHEGIDNLLEMILLSAEMAELKANPNRNARGLVLEAKLDKGRGPVATILVQKGTLKQGDFIACGSAYGRVRAMSDEKGRRLHKATPSMPAEIIGLSSVPGAGEVLVALDSDKEAKAFAATFVSEEKKNKIEETKTQMSLEQLYEQIKEGNLKELPIVVKADVQGSAEALRQNLTKLSNEEVVVKVIHSGVGAISESDIALASASNAIVIGFNVRPDVTAKTMAEAQKVDVHTYSVIYEAIGDVERALKGMRAAVYEEKILGHAEIRQIFRSSSTGNIAGAYVKDGVLQRNCKVRILRKDEKIYEGQLASLKRFKDDAKEVREGFECGLVFDGFGDFEIEDWVEAYTMVQVEQD
ncbi:MAG: translation initiation factor IF-2, partial [Lachnospiraceae bacterium]